MTKTLILLAAAVLPAVAAPNFDFKLLDKLAANAKDSTNITLEGPVLKMALGLLGSDKNADSVKSLVSRLNGIYVRSFEYDAPGRYNAADLEPLRTYLDAGHWTKIVDTKEGKEVSSIYVLPLAGDQFGGLAVISAEEKEVSVILIDGQVSMNDLGKLGGLGIPDMSTLTDDGKKAAKAKKEE
jgi:Domain of unknown function (DUF4252)